MKPMPLHVQEWEAEAMAAGAMTQKRVPLNVRWTPPGKSEPIPLVRALAKAPPGALFWIAEPHTFSRGRRSFEAMEHLDYGTSPLKKSKRPAIPDEWKTTRCAAEQMTRGMSRMTIEVVEAGRKPVIEISDQDVVYEGMGWLTSEHLRSAFLRKYREAYGQEFGSWDLDCMVVRFKVFNKNIGAVLREREAA